ncbi:proline-rich protein 36-like [Rhinatrema bivittatum]|uniref:proline-rich protein 36-like n=1 Tax=Rhinatrema bivittatum TaxID=194408 RepID=UPI001125C98E|nr:proline-rich protein 36-like [Rhinatrema bivittatum]
MEATNFHKLQLALYKMWPLPVRARSSARPLLRLRSERPSLSERGVQRAPCSACAQSQNAPPCQSAEFSAPPASPALRARTPLPVRARSSARPLLRLRSEPERPSLSERGVQRAPCFACAQSQNAPPCQSAAFSAPPCSACAQNAPPCQSTEFSAPPASPALRARTPLPVRARSSARPLLRLLSEPERPSLSERGVQRAPCFACAQSQNAPPCQSAEFSAPPASPALRARTPLPVRARSSARPLLRLRSERPSLSERGVQRAPCSACAQSQNAPPCQSAEFSAPPAPPALRTPLPVRARSSARPLLRLRLEPERPSLSERGVQRAPCSACAQNAPPCQSAEFSAPPASPALRARTPLPVRARSSARPLLRLRSERPSLSERGVQRAPCSACAQNAPPCPSAEFSAPPASPALRARTPLPVRARSSARPLLRLRSERPSLSEHGVQRAPCFACAQSQNAPPCQSAEFSAPPASPALRARTPLPVRARSSARPPASPALRARTPLPVRARSSARPLLRLLSEPERPSLSERGVQRAPCFACSQSQNAPPCQSAEFSAPPASPALRARTPLPVRARRSARPLLRLRSEPERPSLSERGVQRAPCFACSQSQNAPPCQSAEFSAPPASPALRARTPLPVRARSSARPLLRLLSEPEHPSLSERGVQRAPCFACAQSQNAPPCPSAEFSAPPAPPALRTPLPVRARSSARPLLRPRSERPSLSERGVQRAPCSACAQSQNAPPCQSAEFSAPPAPPALRARTPLPVRARSSARPLLRLRSERPSLSERGVQRAPCSACAQSQNAPPCQSAEFSAPPCSACAQNAPPCPSAEFSAPPAPPALRTPLPVRARSSARPLLRLRLEPERPSLSERGVQRAPCSACAQNAPPCQSAEFSAPPASPALRARTPLPVRARSSARPLLRLRSEPERPSLSERGVQRAPCFACSQSQNAPPCQSAEFSAPPASPALRARTPLPVRARSSARPLLRLRSERPSLSERGVQRAPCFACAQNAPPCQSAEFSAPPASPALRARTPLPVRARSSARPLLRLRLEPERPSLSERGVQRAPCSACAQNAPPCQSAEFSAPPASPALRARTPLPVRARSSARPLLRLRSEPERPSLSERGVQRAPLLRLLSEPERPSLSERGVQRAPCFACAQSQNAPPCPSAEFSAPPAPPALRTPLPVRARSSARPLLRLRSEPERPSLSERGVQRAPCFACAQNAPRGPIINP